MCWYANAGCLYDNTLAHPLHWRPLSFLVWHLERKMCNFYHVKHWATRLLNSWGEKAIPPQGQRSWFMEGCSSLCSGRCPDITQWLLKCSGGLADGQLNCRNHPASLTFWPVELQLPPSPLHLCTTTVLSLQPLHTPHFLDTPSPNCSHYQRLMSGAACASRCPWGARKRAWMSVFSLLNAGDWSLDWLVRSVASTAVLTSHSPACSCTFLRNRLDMRTS